MATLAELTTATRALVGDVVRLSSGGAVLAGPQTWTDAQIQDAINQACLDYCEKTGVSYLEVMITSDDQGFVTLLNPYIDVNRVIYEWANS